MNLYNYSKPKVIPNVQHTPPVRNPVPNIQHTLPVRYMIGKNTLDDNCDENWDDYFSDDEKK